MTVSNTTTFVVHRGNGAATQFPYAFRIPEATMAKVSIRDYTTKVVTQVLSSGDFTMSNNSWDNNLGGYVTYPLVGPALTNAYEIVIERVVTYTQGLSIQNQGGFFPDAITKQLDFTTFQVLQLADLTSRAWIAPLGQTGKTLAVLAEGHFWAADVSGNMVDGGVAALTSDVRIVNAVQNTRAITAGTGLTGGGTLAADRAFALSAGSIASLAKADTATQPGDLGTSASRNVGTTAGTVAAGDDSRIVNATPNTRAITAGTGLTGGGNFTADRALALSAGSIASLALADTAVQPARTIIAGTGLTGGGSLAADRTLALSGASIASLALADTSVQPARAISAGTGLTGGGTLAADRTLALSAGSIASLAKADTAVQPGALGTAAAQNVSYFALAAAGLPVGGSTGQALRKTSNADFAVGWSNPPGGGDMLAATYDPTNKAVDVYLMANMVEGTTQKIMTDVERTKLAGVATGAQTGTVTTFTLAAPSAGISVTNGTISTTGTIQLGLLNDLQAVEALATNGIAVRTATSAWTTRTLTAPAAGLTISNGDGVSGNPTFALANGLASIEGLATTGIIRQTVADTFTAGGAVALSELATIAAGTWLGNTTGGALVPTAYTTAQLRTALDAAQLTVEDQVLGGGASVTSKSLGTITTGTVTPDPGDRPLQHYTNNGAHTLAPGTVTGSYLLDITNGASAGAITTSGWTKVSGDAFSVTNGNKFRCHCSVANGGSLLIVQAMQ